MRLKEFYLQLRHRRAAAITRSTATMDPTRIVMELPRQKQTLESMTRAAQTRSGKSTVRNRH
ncbi:MAG: hypothetical protein EA349_00150 [Halomonadaceae bacterium]|nr:MAG: hypothetical protein EA349_00150 [Halomonadaceae bacterium]